MFEQQKTKNNNVIFNKPEPFLTREELIVMIGLIVVSLGLVFLLGQAEIITYSSPWWTLFIGVPGLVFLGASAITVRHQDHITPVAVAQFVFGLLATLVAFSFVVDPTWSFTRDWTLFRGEFWNVAWRWGLVILGAAIVAAGFSRSSLPTGVFGALVAIVGLVFVFNISWNFVWPVAIIAVGVGILSLLFRLRQ
jgi:hypothetical protein